MAMLDVCHFLLSSVVILKWLDLEAMTACLTGWLAGEKPSWMGIASAPKNEAD